ncbi:MAG: peptide deformylase [Chlamydiia bacterium]|nr:peptide deformylase [Chlamydiia bacterium]
MSDKERPRREGGRVLPVLYYGHPVLRAKAKPIESIDDDIRQLVCDMIETMWEDDGMGLAAPQVGRSLRLFVMSVPEEAEHGEGWVYPEPTVYINPVLTCPSEDAWVMDEGCLSIPGVRGKVRRPLRIHVRALNEKGEEFEQDLHGWDARCVMHENDHLNGVLYPDRMTPDDRRKIEGHLRYLKKQYRPK